jgi:hypothetical protein
MYGKGYEVREEMWAHTYRYKVSSGIRVVLLDFKQYVLCYIDIVGNWTLGSCGGQPKC